MVPTLGWAVGCVAAVLLCGEAGKPQIVVADKGKTTYTIVRAVDAAEPTVYAAADLRAILKRITGAAFPVVPEGKNTNGPRIIVGPCAASRKLLGEQTVDALGPDDFIVKTTGQDLLLVGGQPRGTLYAVYAFLETQGGCRWFNWYGEEFVPSKRTFSVGPLDRRESPAFENRDIYFLHYMDLDTAKLFLVRNRVAGPAAGRCLDAKLGGSPYRHHHPGVHSLYFYVNPDRYFKEHPEWFSLWTGKRAKQQICFTNPQLRRTMTENVLAHIEKKGGSGLFSISAMDRPGEFCQCAKCRALAGREKTPGAPLFDYLVELAAAVQAKYPHALLTTLAYRKDQTEKPPATLPLPDNLVVIFAPIDDNFAAGFQHPSNAATLENLKAWAARTKRLWVWYYTNPYGRQGPLPIGNIGKLARDFRLCKRLGVTGFFPSHGVGISVSHLLADLQTWLLAKVMWDPDQDLQALIADFTEHYYGPAAGPIRRYIALLEEATGAMKTGMVWCAAAPEYRFLTPSVLAKADHLFDAAVAAVGSDPELLLRVRQARMSLDRALIVFWSDLATRMKGKVTKEQVAQRYRATWRETVRQRVTPAFRKRLAGYVDNFLEPRMAMTAPKPLPKPLAGIPKAKVRQVFPDMTTIGGGSELKPDPAAATGICVTRPTQGKLPFTFGYYDAITRRQVHVRVQRHQIVSPAYRLYKVARTTLNERCRVWITWWIGFPLGPFFDVDRPGRQWDIYASLRFEGPTYPHGQKGNVDRVYVDRVVLVQVEAK